MGDKKWHRANYASRRAAGLCVWCNTPTAINPRNGRPHVYCPEHLQRSAASTRRYVAGTRRQWRSVGACYDCGTPCQTNPLTGKPYGLCLEHRVRRGERRSVRAVKASKADMRVLAVLPWGQTLTQQAIRTAARMDSSTCGQTLRRLAASGVLEQREADTGKRGRPAFLYRRRQAAEQAA